MGVTRAMMNDTHQENVELRAKLQAAESALKLVIRELDYLLATPITAGDIHYARGVLAEARVVLERGPICLGTRALPVDPPQTPFEKYLEGMSKDDFAAFGGDYLWDNTPMLEALNRLWDAAESRFWAT